MTTTETARPAYADVLARTLNTYRVMVHMGTEGLTGITVYAPAGDIARRKAARKPGVRAVGTVTRTHIKGRPVQ